MGYVIVDPSDVRARPGPHPAASPYDKSLGDCLGLTAFAAYFVDLPPHQETVQHDHSHDGVEDLYVVMTGGGWLLAGDERLSVRPHMFVTISMDTEHLMLAGEAGMGFVAVCGPARFRMPDARTGYADGMDDEKRIALQAVADRVSSYQDSAPDGTVEAELRSALGETEVELEESEIRTLANAIEEHSEVDVADVLG